MPKTIDNDVSGTQRTFGFDTAVSTATEAIDKLHTTAESHERVMVVELMGRYAGWIALYSGLSGSADVILIPEIPFDIEKVCDKIRAPRGGRAGTSASWWWPRGRGPRTATIELLERRGVGTVDRLGGIGEQGGARDRAAHRQGDAHPGAGPPPARRHRPPPTTGCWRCASARRRCAPSPTGRFGIMVGLNGPDITRVPLDEVVGRPKNVPLDSDIIATARELGISLGD